jgi:uncharacterized repeat protein (TIGR01451 family)
LPVGTVGAGETKTFTLALTPRATGKLGNEAAVTADGGLKDTAKHTVTVQEAQLSLKQVGPAKRYAGRPATYTITVTNPGETTLDNVVVREQLPVELTFKNADSNGQFDRGAVVWSLGSLKPQESKVVQVTATCSRLTPGAIALATATAAPDLRAEDKATTKVLGLPGFRVELVDLEDPIPVGGKTTYKIDVTNQGSLAGDQVKIVARIPEQMKFLSATGPAKYTVEDSGRRLVFEAIDGVAPGKKLTYTVDCQAEMVGTAIFHIEMSAASLSRPVEEQESTNIYQPGQSRAATPGPRSTQPPTTPVTSDSTAPRVQTPAPVPPASGGNRTPTPLPATPAPKPDDLPAAPTPTNAPPPTPPPSSSGPQDVPPPDISGPTDVPPPGAPTTGPDGKPRDAMPELPPPR